MANGDAPRKNGLAGVDTRPIALLCPSCLCSSLCSLRRRGNSESFPQLVADAQGLRRDGQRRVDRGRRWKERRIDDVQVVQVVRATIGIKHRLTGIMAEPECAALM